MMTSSTYLACLGVRSLFFVVGVSVVAASLLRYILLATEIITLRNKNHALKWSIEFKTKAC